MEADIISFLVNLVQNQPYFVTIVMVLGTFRAIFKPLMAVVDAYVLSTPNATDDAAVLKFKEGKIYWVLNYITSIKIPK